MVRIYELHAASRWFEPQKIAFSFLFPYKIVNRLVTGVGNLIPTRSDTYSEPWITRTAGDYKKVWVMLSLCFNQSYELCSPYVTTVAGPLSSSVFHFLAKLSKSCEIFLSCEKKIMKLSLLHKNVNTFSHRKGNLITLTAVYQFELWLKVREMPSKLSSPRQGLWLWSLVWVKQVFELSEVELTEFHCMLKLTQVLS